MTELGLIQIYNEGRIKGLLPNSTKLNEYVYDELINASPKSYDTWYLIYSTYSSTGILEYCFQKGRNCFSWQQVAQLFNSEEASRDIIIKRTYGKYLKNKRSKY